MRNIKTLSLALILAGVATFSVVSFGRDMKKKTESCCAMECCKAGCCCCKGDSCEMGELKNKDKQN